ncbi:PH domain-containing protein [Sphingomonas canadensis]|uniref:PH domain-containing protein n=1 Tax=Sphingomonas canadensis TaxID=1219257 RepID=A0ABW3HAT5_9SPHN|nr:PH domain-containing protein [Sphingomonas canadensis]MCW3837921.1 PH domain-containing protein [Sphingomonas canadensis]
MTDDSACAPGAEEPGEGPKRTAPATILIRFLKEAPSSIIGLVALLALAQRQSLGAWAVLVLLGWGVAMVLFAWLRWRSFTYEIAEGEVVIAQGLLHRSRRSIPFERIQDVSIERSPLARLLGLALVRIETGGGDKDEGKLDSVTLAEAERLRATLRGGLGRRNAAAERPASGAHPAVEEDDDADLVFATGLGRVLLAGAFNFSLIWVAAIFGVLQTFDDFIDWRGLFDAVGREVEAHSSLTELIGAAAIGIGITIGLGFVAGMARTVLRDFGFRLTHAQGRFRRTRGLLTRSEVVIDDRRIQLALLRRGLISGHLGWVGLDFQTLGGSNDTGGRQQAAPFARVKEAARVVAAAGLPRLEQPALVPVSSGHIVRAAIRHGGPLALAAGIGAIFLPPLIWLFLLLPVPVGLALLRRRNHRYGMRETSLQVMRGVLVRRCWIVPYGAVQVVSVRRGPLQRLLGTASVSVDTAGAGVAHHPNVEDLAVDDAVALARGLLERA